jgi:hypothetical protein
MFGGDRPDFSGGLEELCHCAKCLDLRFAEPRLERGRPSLPEVYEAFDKPHHLGEQFGVSIRGLHGEREDKVIVQLFPSLGLHEQSRGSGVSGR